MDEVDAVVVGTVLTVLLVTVYTTVTPLLVVLAVDTWVTVVFEIAVATAVMVTFTVEPTAARCAKAARKAAFSAASPEFCELSVNPHDVKPTNPMASKTAIKARFFKGVLLGSLSTYIVYFAPGFEGKSIRISTT